MLRLIAAVAVTLSVGLCSHESASAQDAYYYAAPSYYVAPPVVYQPYYAPPVYYAPAPVAVYRPVVVAPVIAPAPVAAYPVAPVYAAPYKVKYRSGPWFSKTEYSYYTPYGKREIEYKYDRWGNFSVEYDD